MLAPKFRPAVLFAALIVLVVGATFAILRNSSPEMELCAGVGLITESSVVQPVRRSTPSCVSTEATHGTGLALVRALMVPGSTRVTAVVHGRVTSRFMWAATTTTDGGQTEHASEGAERLMRRSSRSCAELNLRWRELPGRGVARHADPQIARPNLVSRASPPLRMMLARRPSSPSAKPNCRTTPNARTGAQRVGQEPAHSVPA